jgi:hypothetical protein
MTIENSLGFEIGSAGLPALFFCPAAKPMSVMMNKVIFLIVLTASISAYGSSM